MTDSNNNENISNEKLVRETWVEVPIKLAGRWWLFTPPDSYNLIYSTREEAISAAAAFTRERLAQIQQVEEEIGWIEKTLALANDCLETSALASELTQLDICVAINNRILIAEKQRLAQLKKGMK